MKISIRALTAGLLVSAFAAPVFAQSLPLPAGVPFAPTENRADLRHDARLQEFLSHHPEVRHDLNRDPNLINDPEYVKKHPGLHEFMEKHPNIGNTAEDRPRYESEHAKEKAERKAGIPEAAEPATAGASGAPETGKETRAERRAERKAKRAGTN